MTASIFTIADDGNFLGLVALVSSLRTHGVFDVVTVLDRGLSPAQHAQLGDTCRLVSMPETDPVHPWLLSPYAAALAPDGIVLYVDCDVIVTGPLDDVFAAAKAGQVCVGTDPFSDRWFPEWTECFGLRAPLRRQPYANSGAVAFSTTHHPDLLARWWDCCAAIPPDSVSRSQPFERPTGLGDQDAWNALLMSEVPADAVRWFPGFVHDARFVGVEVEDVRRVRCRLDGEPTVLLHAAGSPKPWSPRAWRANRPNAYVRCMRALLRAAAAPDATPRVDARTLQPWLRPGPVGTVAAAGAYAWAWTARWSEPVRRRARRRSR